MERAWRYSAILAAALLLGGCNQDLMVPSFNDPSVDELTGNPTPTAIAAATQGLLRGTRSNVAEMVRWTGAFGREGYPMAPTGSSLPGSVRDPLDGSAFPGNVLWNQPYRNIRNAHLLLDALDREETMSSAQKEAVRGFAKTILAYDFLQIAVTRYTFGAPIDVNREPTDDPAPIASQEEVLAHIATLLDEGRTHLQAGGAAFPFQVTSGLAAFNTPATFIQLNRALKARVDVYRSNWSDALASLAESFLNTDLAMDYGAYHVFSTGSGDATNPNFNPGLLWAHMRLREEAQLRPDGSRDLRFEEKTHPVSMNTLLGISSDIQFTIYDHPGAPIPWIKNEELLLIRAEANLNLDNLSAAIADINEVRARSGGLAPIPDPYPGDLLDELLYNRRYSLVWEFGHTWTDMRRYDKLAEIPVTPADPRLFEAMPFTVNECLPRQPQPPGCAVVVGITP